jgi:hypothetical protein
MRKVLLLPSILLGVLLSSCCDPTPRQSFPQVIGSSYSDTAIKDAGVNLNGGPADSIFYPIYSVDIKNTGTEADTFTISFDRKLETNNFALTAKQFVLAGETKTFKTYGPVPKNSPDTSKYRFFTFFVSTADSIPVSVIRPAISVTYGATDTDPEACGAPAKTLTVSIDSLKKK